MATAAVIGSTGAVGAFILSNLLASSAFATIDTIGRRAPKDASSPKLRAAVEPDTSAWAAKLSALQPTPSVVLSALGTTRAQAGGIANQWKIDHDLNVELARAAKAAGVRTFVFVSSAGSRGAVSSRTPYFKMKNGVEDAVRDLGFDHAVIIRPGFILAEREGGQGSWTIGLVRGLGRLSGGARDAFAQEAEVIGRAAVRAAQLVEEGKAPDKYWVVEQADIVRLGRTEWTDE